MNQTLFLSQLRVIILVGIAYAAGKGWLSPADSTALTSVLAPLGVIIGPWLWSIYSNFNSKLVPKDSVVIEPHTPSDAAAPVGANVAGKVIAVLLVAFALSFLVAIPSAMAQAPKPRPQINFPIDPLGLNKPGAQTGDIGYDLLKALDAKLLPDLQYALLLAKATSSNVTAGCYQAWIDMITVQQTAVKDSTGAEIATPDPHLVTDFERMVELRNALQPDSKFMVACSPVANMVKQDVIKFMGIIISGGAGLATMVPGL
jgi:hypothetical protein